jgi:hypothetical protein
VTELLKDLAAGAMVQWTAVDGVSPSASPSLPADRTFVVQFRASPGQAEDGRVEHLVSGSAAKFTTWAELRDFVEQVLIRQHEEMVIDEGGRQ